MKKLISAVLIVFALVFGANSYGAEVVLPDPNAKLSEAVQVDPDLVALIPVSALENIKWRVRNGENLWTIAKRYAEYKGVRPLNRYVDEIVELNKDNRCVKSRDLVLANCVINIPAYRAAQVRVQSAFNEQIFEAEKQNATGLQKSFDSYKRRFLVGIVALILILIVLVAASTSSSIEQNKVIADLKRENQKLEKDLWEANDQRETLAKELRSVQVKLDIAKQLLALQDGATEEIKRQKQENDRLAATVSELYIEKDHILGECAACAVGASYSFESRDNGTIHGAYRVKKNHIEPNGHPVVDLLECASEGCGAEVMPTDNNCNSHYWKQHGSSRDEKPNSSYE